MNSTSPESKPLFSVVIPTFNPGNKLARTLDSLRAQNADDLQIFVQDGHSTDETRAFLELQSDVEWTSERDEGVFDAMNRGRKRARGDFIAFFGAGDELAKGALDVLRPLALEHRERAALLYGDAWLCEEEFRYGGPFSRLKLRSWTPCHQAVWSSRHVFDLVGGFETRYAIAADYAWNLKCWGDRRIEKIHVPHVLCRFEGRGLSKQGRDNRFERDKMRLVRHRLGSDAWMLRRLELAMPRGLKAARVRVLQALARRKSHDCTRSRTPL